MADWDEYLNNQENIDGVRFSWNLLPHSKVDAQKLVVPPGVFFTPLKERPAELPPLPPLNYDPVMCQKPACKAVLNPLCICDYRTKSWTCAICHNRNPFPPHYAAISETNQPPDVNPQLTTIEYILNKATTLPPIFFFVIDICQSAEELKALKETIQKELSTLPAESFVGLITFSRTIELRGLDAKNAGRSYVFSGNKEVTPKQIRDVLGLNIGRPGGAPGSAATTPAPGAPGPGQFPHPGQQFQQRGPGPLPGQAPGQFPPGAGVGQFPQPGAPGQFPQTGAPGQFPQPGVPGPQQVAPGSLPLGPKTSVSSQPGGPGHVPYNKFLQPLSDCEQILNDLIEQIGSDRWPVPQGHRSLRATGSALAVAVSFLETCFPNTGARIMTFIGGACTFGPGMVVNEELKSPIRSWHDIKEENTPYMRKATKFYDSLAARAVKNGHAIDIYSCALDQTGLLEMKNLYNSTNGHVIMADSFNSTLFKQSFAKVFEKDVNGNLKMAFNATMEVKLSTGLKVEGTLGCCASSGVRNAIVSDTEVGVGGTCQWKFCSLTPRNTCALLFEIAAQHGSALPQGARAVIQFVTQYQHADGRKRIRVTTTARTWADFAQQQASVAYGFDQDASAVIMARLASFRASNENDSPDTMRWLDRSLIRLIQKFSEFHPSDPASLKINERFQAYPQFMFHLRRSQFLQVFNNSPDETAYYRHVLFVENVGESTSMIQPMLYSYSFNGPPEPVLLDTSSIQPDRILLMDDYFHVLIYHGQTIDQWKRANYHEDPQYATFKQLLEAPIEDASQLLAERFPVPRYIQTQHEGSQARFLLSKVNPSTTHNTYHQQDSAAAVFTDDVSFQVFTEHLRRLVCQGNS